MMHCHQPCGVRRLDLSVCQSKSTSSNIDDQKMIKSGRAWFHPHRVDSPNSRSDLQICTIEASRFWIQLPPAATVKPGDAEADCQIFAFTKMRRQQQGSHQYSKTGMSA